MANNSSSQSGQNSSAPASQNQNSSEAPKSQSSSNPQNVGRVPPKVEDLGSMVMNFAEGGKPKSTASEMRRPPQVENLRTMNMRFDSGDQDLPSDSGADDS